MGKRGRRTRSVRARAFTLPRIENGFPLLMGGDKLSNRRANRMGWEPWELFIRNYKRIKTSNGITIELLKNTISFDALDYRSCRGNPSRSSGGMITNPR